MKLFNKSKVNEPVAALLDDIDMSVLTEQAYEYNDIWFSRSAFASKVFINASGVFVFVPTKYDLSNANKKERGYLAAVIADIKEALGLSIFVYFIFINENGAYFSLDGKRYAAISDMETFIINMYDAVHFFNASPEDIYAKAGELSEEDSEVSEDMWFKNNIDDATLDRLFLVLEGLKGKRFDSDKTFIDNDGTEFVLKDSSVHIGPVDTGLVGKKKWFRLSAIPAEKLMLLASFGGCLGLHQFAIGNVAHGILYLLSCGFGGLLPAADVLMLLLGTFYYSEVSYYEDADGKLTKHNEKVFIKRPERRKRYALLVITALIIGVAWAAFVYKNGFNFVCEVLSKFGMFLGEQMNKK